MEICEGGGGVSNKGKSSDGFIDRSRVRILLCDNDPMSLEHAVTLLCKCSYQVTSVKSPRQVIDALNAEGPDIDLILAEVDLPMAKGMKMLRYITRDKDLRRIPVIMMSAQDEISVVVKCLRLGAADYLLKPLRTNELLNLWTHMWRRRRTLGLAEKNLLNYDFDLVASDPSDPNTNSTTLFSDDTDDKFKKTPNSEVGLSKHQEDESVAAVAIEPTSCQPVAGFIDCQKGPKKSELRIGESSAFFTYVKSKMANCSHQLHQLDVTQDNRAEENFTAWGKEVGNVTHAYENGEAWESCSRGDDLPSSSSFPESQSMERSGTSPVMLEFPQQRNVDEQQSVHMSMHPSIEPQLISDSPLHLTYPYSMHGGVNQVMMSSSSQMYQQNLHDLQNHVHPAMLSQCNQIPQFPPQVVGMASFPYYPVNLCLQPSQVANSHPWPSYGGSLSTDVKLGKVDRRVAALMKFRQKRKERCYDKKIRYVNRKRLAERRPRVRGQFVRKVNGVNVDLNGQPDLDYDEEVDDDGASRDSFPEDDGMGCQS